MKHLRKNTSAKKCIVLSTNTFDSGYAVWKWMQELLRFKFTPWNGWMFELYRARRLKSLTQWAPVLALSRGSSSSSAAKGSPRTFSCLLAKVLVEAKKFAAPFFKVLLVCPHHGVDISQGLTQLPQVANCVFPCSQSAMRPVGRALPLLRASNDLMAVSRSALSTDRKHSRCSMRSKLSSAASAAVMAGRWHTRRRQRTARRGFARRSSLCTVSIWGIVENILMQTRTVKESDKMNVYAWDIKRCVTATILYRFCTTKVSTNLYNFLQKSLQISTIFYKSLYKSLQFSTISLHLSNSLQFSTILYNFLQKSLQISTSPYNFSTIFNNSFYKSLYNSLQWSTKVSTKVSNLYDSLQFSTFSFATVFYNSRQFSTILSSSAIF